MRAARIMKNNGIVSDLKDRFLHLFCESKLTIDPVHWPTILRRCERKVRLHSWSTDAWQNNEFISRFLFQECVYKIVCHWCDSVYMWERTITMRSRLRQHLTWGRSLVHEHLTLHLSSPNGSYLKFPTRILKNYGITCCSWGILPNWILLVDDSKWCHNMLIPLSLHSQKYQVNSKYIPVWCTGTPSSSVK